MLSKADQRIIVRDISLPGLRLALDPGTLVKRFGLPQVGSHYLRYKPRTSCVVALAPQDHSLAAVTVMAYPPARFAEVMARDEWRAGSNPVIFDTETCIAIVPLSRDRDLKGARRIANPLLGPDFMQHLTGQALSKPRLLRYKPGRRLVIRTETALIKAYSKTDFEPALEGARIAEHMGGAPILGVSRERRCIAWAWLDGASLCPETGAKPDPAAWQSAGAALARTHRSPLRPQTQISPSDTLALAAFIPDLHALLPELAALAAPMIETLASQLSDAIFEPTLIHGDFSADQVLIDATGARIVDWDRAATGDPACDIGSALARLDAQVIGGVLARGDRDVAARALAMGYGDPLSPRAVAIQQARALLALVPEAFRQRRADWPEHAKQLIERAAEVMQPVAKARSVTTDPKMPSLDEALDPALMAELIAKTTKLPVDAVSVDLLRHKPGRRALIRYRIEPSTGSAALLGKLRTKGVDRRTPDLHAALRNDGLDGRSGVGIPSARGMMDQPPLWLQDEVPGHPLTAALHPGADTTAALRTGAALARLHLASVAVDRAWTNEDEMAVLKRNLDQASADRPFDAACINAIESAAKTALCRLGTAATRGIHRDFYPDQVLIEPNIVWLLDLDLYTHGDPAIDLGNFLAHLDELGLRHHGQISALGDHSDAFLRGYETLQPIDLARVEIFRWVSLARHINLSRAIEGRGHTTRALIDHCSRRCSDAPDPRNLSTCHTRRATTKLHDQG